MSSLEEAEKPKDTSALRPISPSFLTTIGSMAGVIPQTPAAPNPYLRTTLPPQLTTEPDRLRQFYNGSVKQQRSMPLAAASNPNIGASAKSAVTKSTSAGTVGTVTSVGLSMPSIFSVGGPNPITSAGTF